MVNYTLMKHQEVMARNCQQPAAFSTDEAGTGKSLAVLHAWAERRVQGGGRMLVFAPKSCVGSVWYNEVDKFFSPTYRCGTALAPNRAPAFNFTNDVVAMNHDGVKWLVENMHLLKDFDTLVWDESDSIRHNSARTKAALKLSKSKNWKHKACLSATPFNKSVAELFYQVLFLDGGARLGKSYFKFRSAICDPIQVGPSANHIQWQDKADAPAAVAGLLQDISTRFKLQDVVEMPDIIHRSIKLDLPRKLMQAYQELKTTAVLQLKSDDVISVNAAVLANKLLQICSGSIYGEKESHIINTSRYELAAELAKESRPTVIFYNYKHQRIALEKELKKLGLITECIDGSVSTDKRAKLVQLFQNGIYDCLLLQINSAAHGITLTNSARVVFVTPPYSPSIYAQAFGRIYRKGQHKKCESILLTAKGTIEEGVVQTLIERGEKQRDLLELLE